MERERRQIKAPKVYEDLQLFYRPIKRKKAKKRVQRAQYQVIPTPMKFSSVATFFAIYADIGLRTYQGSLHHDIRSLNMYCDVRGMEIVKEQNLRKIYLTMEKKVQLQLPAWQNLVEGLLESDNNEMREWGVRIKNFSLSYEETHRTLSSCGMINGMNEKELIKTTEKTDKKISQLLKEHPCIYFTSTSENNSSSVNRVCFNEQYLDETGYSLESFATAVLKEGFPNMIPYNTIYAAKILLENYFSLGKDGIETSDIISDLVMKNGYLKQVRYKILYLPSYRNRVYHVTGIVVLLGKENTIVKGEADETCEWNKTFLKQVISKEKNINKFMKKFYDRTLILPHTSAHKVCKIRELESVKINEEDTECSSKKEDF